MKLALLLALALSACSASHVPEDAGAIPAWHPPPRGCHDDCWFFDSTPRFADGGAR